jgi:3-oxochol-4-en-24-oyl-CoA dehydrogenase
VSIATTPELRALQASLLDFSERAECLATVRASEQGQAAADPAVFQIADPADMAGSVMATAVAAEQLAVSIVPGPVMPTLLAALILQTAQPPASSEPSTASHPSTARQPVATAAPIPAAVALDVGALIATAQPDGTLRVSGETGPILGASATTTLLLAAARRDAADHNTDHRRAIWFLLDPATPGVTITSLAPLDFSRSLARVRIDDVPVTAIDGISTRWVRDLAATLFAAEAAGVAAWCSATATEYAKTRKQFGRLISEFQAVKHLCAFMHCRAERAAALAWDAARAADAVQPGMDARRHQLAAAAAAAQALDDAVENAKDCIQVLGGIGFTWEHDAHLYLRRALALRQLLGGTDKWRARAAEIARSEPSFAVQATEPAPDIGIGAWAAPAIRQHGTPEQQERFIGPTMRGEITWCQLFSEPEAGSDLAGLRMKAIRVDGGWRLTGQKVWTSLAREADWAICLARTDPDVPKHKGLSYFLVNMHESGIDIRPLREITGRAVFNEVFLDDVFVPDDCLVGAPGDGWRIAMSTLATERESIAGDDILALRGAHPAVRKLLGVEQRQQSAEAALTALGPDGAVAGEASFEFLLTRCLSIAGGTTQILLNQVAERVLGLPRDPALAAPLPAPGPAPLPAPGPTPLPVPGPAPSPAAPTPPVGES